MRFAIFWRNPDKSRELCKNMYIHIILDNAGADSGEKDKKCADDGEKEKEEEKQPDFTDQFDDPVPFTSG